MRESSVTSKVRKYDYINATESVLKLLRIVNDCSPKRFSENKERSGHETLELRSIQASTNETINLRRKERKKNSLKSYDFDRRRLLPPIPKRHCLDTSEAEAAELLLPTLESRRLERANTQPPASQEQSGICSSMHLVKKQEMEAKLEALRSKQNLYSLCAFEDSLSRPLPSVIYSCKKRVRTDYSNRNLHRFNKDAIEKLQKVLIDEDSQSLSRKPAEPKGLKGQKAPQMKYDGWEFERTNHDWEYSIMEAVKNKK